MLAGSRFKCLKFEGLNREDAKARSEPFRSNEGLRGESGKVEKLRRLRNFVACCWQVQSLNVQSLEV